MAKESYNPRIVSLLILFVLAISIFTIGFTYQENAEVISRLNNQEQINDSIEKETSYTEAMDKEVLGEKEGKPKATLRLEKITNSIYVIYADLENNYDLAGFELDLDLSSSNLENIECGKKFECIDPKIERDNVFITGITPIYSQIQKEKNIPLATLIFKEEIPYLEIDVQDKSSIYSVNSTENLLNNSNDTIISN